MAFTRIHLVVLSAWLMALLAMFGAPAVVGMSIPFSVAITGMLLTGIPIALFLLLYRGAPPQTIGQILYDAEHSPSVNGGQPPRQNR